MNKDIDPNVTEEKMMTIVPVLTVLAILCVIIFVGIASQKLSNHAQTQTSTQNSIKGNSKKRNMTCIQFFKKEGR